MMPKRRIIAFKLTFCLCLTKFALTSSSQAAGKALSGNRCTQTRWKSPNTLMPPDAGARRSTASLPQDPTIPPSTPHRADVRIARGRGTVTTSTVVDDDDDDVKSLALSSCLSLSLSRFSFALTVAAAS